MCHIAELDHSSVSHGNKSECIGFYLMISVGKSGIRFGVSRFLIANLVPILISAFGFHCGKF